MSTAALAIVNIVKIELAEHVLLITIFPILQEQKLVYFDHFIKI